MKKNGFTLAEILGVVIILGVLMTLVSVPKYFDTIKLNKAEERLIIAAAENYIEKNKAAYVPNSGTSYYISMKQLIDANMLDEKMLDIDQKDTNKDNNFVKLSGNGETFEIYITNSDESLTSKISTQPSINFESGKMFTNNTNIVYVHFGGMLWKVIGRNNDGSVKLMLNETITAMIPNNGDQTYENSFIRKWLNEEFYSKILRKDLIVDGEFCTDTASSTSATHSNCNNIVKDKVGLLSLYDVNSGLNKDLISSGVSFMLSTFNDSHQTYIYNTDKSVSISSSTIPLYIKPVINVYGEAYTKLINNSYNIYALNQTINSYNNSTKETLLEIGNYVKFEESSYTFRIQESTDEYIKLISNDYIINEYYSLLNNPFNINNDIGYKLNNTVFNNLGLNQATYNNFLKNMIYTSDFDLDYNIYQKDKYLIENAFIGIPRLGDLFLTPDTFTSTETSLTQIYKIASPEIINENKSSKFNIKITIFIKNNFDIIGGNGTLANYPYILKAT